MAEKVTGKEKKEEHEARQLSHKEDFSVFHGAEPPIEPPPKRGKK